MVIILILMHAIVLGGVLALHPARGANKLGSLALPVTWGFLYIAVFQGGAIAATESAQQESLEYALLVSLFSVLAFSIAYLGARGKRGAIVAGLHFSETLYRGAVTLAAIGLAGLAARVAVGGGLFAYLGREDSTVDIYSYSGYFYELKNIAFAALGAGLLASTVGPVAWQRSARRLTGLLALVLCFDALNSVDRGNLIRAGLPAIALLVLSRNASPLRRTVAMTGGVAAVVILVLTVVYFRDSGERKFFASQTRLSTAIERAVASGGSSRYSARGGEMDSAIRAIEIRRGSLDAPPGPIPVAYFAWGFVPRHLVPRKHEIFADWAGDGHAEIQRAPVYPGCTLTGWGEAFAYLGWFGAAIYWIVIGVMAGRLERWFHARGAALAFAAVAFLPLVQFAVHSFWAAAMSMTYGVLPVLVLARVAWRSRFRSPKRRATLHALGR